MTKNFISFPPGVLGEEPVRLSLLAVYEDFIALAKPPGMAVGGEPSEKGYPDLLAAMRDGVNSEKKQLIDLGLNHVGKIHNIDAEMSGIVLVSKTAEGEARLRNAAGSGRMEFIHELVAESSNHAGDFECDLPLASRAEGRRVVVSRQSGKKCRTCFHRVEQWARFSLWEGRTLENRPHQIRVHAMESGIGIAGESLYGNVPFVFLSALKRDFRFGKEVEQPLYRSIAVHLARVVVRLDGAPEIAVSCPRPRSFSALLGRIAQARQTARTGTARPTHQD